MIFQWDTLNQNPQLVGGLVLTYGATLVTRNIADFDGYGLKVIDPWR
jgi:hypothetical protein